MAGPLASGPSWGGPDRERVLVSIGDIQVTENWVFTPSGNRPVGEVQWQFTNMSRTSQVIPTWAIVCTVVFVLFCLLGLLFLLAKEERTDGYVQVTVWGGGLVHMVHLPVFSPHQAYELNGRVNMARTISAAGSS